MSEENPFQLTDEATKRKLEMIPRMLAKRAKYLSDFKQDYFAHLKFEYNMLHNLFPNVVMIPEARIKSWSSYYRKMSTMLETGSSSDIYDIFACRYIIDSVDGSKEERKIIPALYAIRNTIAYGNPDIEVMRERFKDFVVNPKHNNYQSLHLTSIHKNHGGYYSETQLRSYFMHATAKNGEAAHANVYKDRIPGQTEVPIILEYVFDENGYCTEVKEMSREKAYEKFFGEPYDAEKDNLTRHDS